MGPSDPTSAFSHPRPNGCPSREGPNPQRAIQPLKPHQPFGHLAPHPPIAALRNCRPSVFQMTCHCGFWHIGAAGQLQLARFSLRRHAPSSFLV